MAKFEIAHKITSLNEGGYANNLYDMGGETYRGISRVYWPNWKGWFIIDEYKRRIKLKNNDYIHDEDVNILVDEFYKKHFWDVNRLSEINNQKIANELFDTGVNMGRKIAAYFLQEALNLLNKNQKAYKDIKVDGVIGDITLKLVNNYKKYHHVVKTLNGLQFERYVGICKRDKSQENNFINWLKRT
jgi:lysozyme family protein